jgi:uncharacterized protein
MLKSVIALIVSACIRRAWVVIVAGMALGLLSGAYTVRHFAITTDVNEMISPKLPWRQRQIDFSTAFPQAQILAVVEAPTPELLELATSELVQGLAARRDVIRQVRELGGGSFFERNALLFLPVSDVERITKQIAEAQPIVGTLVRDQSLRGELNALQLVLLGVQGGQLKSDDLSRPLTMVSAWRAGETHLLQSTLTRAVVFSAMTTGIAFGSLWFSNFPGTSSMGKLMALALVCTLAAAVMFQPVLMGPPRVPIKR